MSKKYLCRICGQLIENDTQKLIEHCKPHHPGTPASKIEIYLKSDFQKVSGSAKASVKTRTIVDEEITGQRYSRLKHIESEIENYYKPKPENFKPSNVPYVIDSTNTEYLFEYAVKKLANHFQTDSNVLEPKTHHQWMNYCFGRERLSYRREDYMTRIKTKYSGYFINKNKKGSKYTFDIAKIKRDFPHFFEGGSSCMTQGLDRMIEVLKTEIRCSKDFNNRQKIKVEKIEVINKVKKLYRLTLEVTDSDIPTFKEGISADLLVNGNFYKCEYIDYDDNESQLYVSTSKSIFGGREGVLYSDMSFILEAVLKRLESIKEGALLENQPGF